MSRTFGGLIFYTASNLVVPFAQNGTGAGQTSLVRNALGDWSWNNVAGVATTNFLADNSVLARPHFNFPAFPGQGTVPLSNEYQEVFGNAAGGPGDPFSGIVPNSPALAGGQFGTPNIPWGIALIDVFAVYSVQTAALTTATLAVNRNIFTENTATTNTAVLAATGVALTTTTSATTPHVQKVTLAQPVVFESADFSSLFVELLITTAATSAVRVYGMGCHYAVEYS